MPLSLSVGTILELKKKHPCGGNTFEVLRIGMDISIKCQTCSRIIMAQRADIEKRIKSIR